MAVPDIALRYFEAATRTLPVFETMRLNTDHTVSRADYVVSPPFRAYVLTLLNASCAASYALLLICASGCMSGCASRSWRTGWASRARARS